MTRMMGPQAGGCSRPRRFVPGRRPSRRTYLRGFPTAAGLGLAAALTLAGRASAASYEFLAAPETDLNRVYRLDKATGEVGACQYGLAGAAPDAAGKADVGVTLCYPPGQGAGAQSQSEYALLASHHTKEGGVFRVDVRAGTMSICYVLDEAVVCTPQAK